jgi:hypothetical protein
MKTHLLQLTALLFFSVSTAQEKELSGTYSGSGITLSFLAGKKVDITVPVPKISNFRSSQITQRSETTITIRSEYLIFNHNDLTGIKFDNVEDIERLEGLARKYSKTAGYSRFISILSSPAGSSIFAESENALVDVFTDMVYKKPWYSW